MHVVIPSSRNTAGISAVTRFFPDATVLTPLTELFDYRSAHDFVMAYPDGLGPAAVFNWALETLQDDIIIFVSDRLSSVAAHVGGQPKLLTDPDEILQVFENAADLALNIGVGAFGFTIGQTSHLSDPTRPIRFTSQVHTVFGVIGKAIHFDPSLRHHHAVDFTLRQLLRKRITFVDLRFVFSVGDVRLTSDQQDDARAEALHLIEHWGERYLERFGQYRLRIRRVRRER